MANRKRGKMNISLARCLLTDTANLTDGQINHLLDCAELLTADYLTEVKALKDRQSQSADEAGL
jgi:hypothetical protein